MGDPPGTRHPQARVPGNVLLTRRRLLLTGIAPFHFGEGRECTFPAALATATGEAYDWVMGTSGAAFDFAIDETGWDPLVSTSSDEATMARAARACAVRLDPVEPPFDDEMRALVLERVVESLDAKLPPLVRGISGPAEMGLIVGCDDEGPRFDCRTYFDKGDKPTRVGWEAFRDAQHGMPFFLDRAGGSDRAALARESLGTAVAAADRSRAAIGVWIAALRDEARWADKRHAGTAAFADHAMRAILADRRRAAARYLRSLRTLLSTPGGDLLRAAESYGYAADAVEKGGTGPFDASVAMRFLDPGHRRGWAKGLEAALGHEAEARDAVAAAREHSR